MEHMLLLLLVLFFFHFPQPKGPSYQIDSQQPLVVGEVKDRISTYMWCEMRVCVIHKYANNKIILWNHLDGIIYT